MTKTIIEISDEEPSLAERLVREPVTREQEMKQELEAIVNAIQAEPSLLTRLARFWGKQALWKKIVGGVLLFGGAIAIGVVGQLPTLIVVGSVSAAGFALGSMLLDNHFKVDEASTKKMRDGLSSLGQVLIITITLLEEISKQLQTNVDKFSAENVALSAQIIAFSAQTAQLAERTKELGATHTDLASLSERYAVLNQKLANKVDEMAELLKVKKAMEVQIARLGFITTTLQSTVQTLVSKSIDDDAVRAGFMGRLEAFLADTTANFDRFVGQISQAERELQRVRVELENSNKRYEELLGIQGGQVGRLEQIVAGVEAAAGATPMRGNVGMFRACQPITRDRAQSLVTQASPNP